MIDTLNKQTRIHDMANNRNKIKIEANNKYLVFRGNANEAIDFVDQMRNRDNGGELNNAVSDFLFNIERGLQDAGVYDEHFNVIHEKDYPELYSGILECGAEVMLRENGDDEWTVDVRDRADNYICGFEFCDYDQAVRKYKELEKEFDKYPFLEGYDYWVIENGQVVEGTWDWCSDEAHDENPYQVYYSSECDAVDAHKLMLIEFLNKQIQHTSSHERRGFFTSAINRIK